jgi:hypothetical protein
MDEAWDLLGIAPTADPAAIRKAYAARLRAIDADREPDAFIALRAAFEHVRSRPDATFPGAEPEPDPPARIDRDADRNTPAQPRIAESVQRIVALSALLAQEAPAGTLRTALDHVLASPDLEHVDRRPSIEIELAELITRSMPASEALFQPIIDHFGWYQVDREWNASPAILRALEMHRDRYFLARYTLPRETEHRAKPATKPPARPRRLSGAARTAIIMAALFVLLFAGFVLFAYVTAG